MAELVDELRVTGRYLIRLCSGELRCWRFEGREPQGVGLWRDEETGLSFSEASIMYAWQIEAMAGDYMADPGALDQSGIAGDGPALSERGTHAVCTPTAGTRDG